MNEDMNKSDDMKKKIIISLLLGSSPLFLIFFTLFVSVFLALGLFDIKSEASGGSYAGGGRETGFTISDTSLSKVEFKTKIQNYANSHSQWQVFADNANDYYDYAKSKNVNPELVVVVAYKEGNGYTTAGVNNYWGLECPNGSTVCGSYYSFMEGAQKLIDNAARYSTLREWFEVGNYSYIGYFWYNVYTDKNGDGILDKWGDGGCAYAPHIYPDGLPERVKNACSNLTCQIKDTDVSDYNSWKVTGINPRPECTPTTDEDQAAYTTFLIKDKMGKAREEIFGLSFEEGINYSYKNGDVVEDYVTWMINFASDDSHGYSQQTRDMNPNVDCSSFVYYGLLQGAGFSKLELGSYAFTTNDMISILGNIGFNVYEYSEDNLVRGDILWRNGHTEVYVGDGKTVGAHSNHDGVDGDSDGTEVNVAVNHSSNKWTSYIRYEGNIE